MSALQEFITENSSRRYPLAEDCVPTDLAEHFVLPDDVVLDIRGFHRIYSTGIVALHALIGSLSEGLGGIAPKSGHGLLLVRIGSELIRVEVPERSRWPLTVTGEIPDPNYPESKLAVIRCTIGSGFSQLDPTKAYDFGDTAPLEHGAIIDGYGMQVDSIQVVPLVGDPYYVGGELKVRGGHNFSVSRYGLAGLDLFASPGAGEGGQCPPLGSSPCSGAIRFINGIGPSSAGNFSFLSGHGVKITNIPAEHKIIIRVDRSSMNPTGACS